MGFEFVQWLLMIFIFFSSSHRDFECYWFDLMMLNEWEWMKVVCWSMKMKLIIWQSFLCFSFLQSRKHTMNEISTSFALFFIFAILMIVSNSRKMKTIVIFFLLFGLWFEKSWFWSTWSKSSKSQLHLQSTFWIWFLLFRLRIGENDESGNRFEICLFATIRENREKRKCDFCHLSNWMKLPRDWIGWMVELVAIKQTTEIQQNKTNDDFDNGRTRFSSSFSEWEKCGFL